MKNILFIGAGLLFLFNIQAQEIDLSYVPSKGFYSNQAARKWEESLVSGNGTMGAMVAGNPYRESIVFNHALLFLPVYTPVKPVTQGEHLTQIRQMMLDGNYGEASRFVVDLSNSDGFNGKHVTDPFIPAFRLNIVSDSSNIKKYSRTVDFTSGEIEVKWEDNAGTFSRKLFISRPDNVVVIKLSSNNKKNINTSLSLSQILTYDAGLLKRLKVDEKCGILKTESGAVEKGLTFRVWYEKTYDNAFNGHSSYKGYDGAIKVVQSRGTVKADSDRLIIKGATEVLLLARVEPSKDMSKSKIEDIFNQLNSLDADYSKLLARHKVVHSDLFSRVSLDLNAKEEDRKKSSEELLKAGGNNPALIEKLFDSARYNIICATGVNPPNLQGIWGATMSPAWSSDFTTNGNLSVSVSHYLQANTPELMLPLFNKLESHMSDFKINAQVLYNCRGIHIPSHISMHGLETQFDATYPMTFWTAGAAWYSLLYYDYYLYTLDKKFLKERALPFMEQAVLFYEDFLTEGTDGKFIFNPSYSPENNPLNSNYQACINATMDVMAANGLLRVLIETSRILGVNQDKIIKWVAMQKKMPAYELNSDGEIREWLWKDLLDNHKHRHASQLFGLYDLQDPLIMQNPEIRMGCKRAINKRLEIRRKDNGGIMAFGMQQLAFSATALGEADIAFEMLTWIGNSYWNNNFVSTHDPKEIFNLDTGGGYPSLVMKMLVYSEPGLVSLLQSTPRVWSKGNVKGIALRGGIILKNLSWNENGGQATLVSKINQTIKLQVRGLQKGELTLKAGVPANVPL